VSLPDHINFAIRRIEQGVDIENPFLNELKVLYAKEYNLASKALIMINERFDMNLPEDEIGFICLHIRAAITKETVIEPLAYTRKLGEVMELISSSLNKKLPKSSLEYTRTITHLNFMIKRTLSGKIVKNQLLDSVKNTLYNEYEIAKNVSKKIEELFSVKVPEDEIGYIAIHLKRLTEV